MGHRLLDLQICRQSRIKAIFKTSSPTNLYQMTSSWSSRSTLHIGVAAYNKYLFGGSKYLCNGSKYICGGTHQKVKKFQASNETLIISCSQFPSFPFGTIHCRNYRENEDSFHLVIVIYLGTIFQGQTVWGQNLPETN